MPSLLVSEETDELIERIQEQTKYDVTKKDIINHAVKEYHEKEVGD